MAEYTNRTAVHTARPSDEHPNLFYTKEVIDTLSSDKRIIRTPKLAMKIAKALDDLNDHGTDCEYHAGGNLENLGGGWWSLRIRFKNDFWRIMFRKTKSPKGKYGLTIMYLKKGNKIPKQKWDAAKKVAKREGWL